MLLVKRRPAAFYGPAPAKPRGREFAAEVASLKRSGFNEPGELEQKTDESFRATKQIESKWFRYFNKVK